MKIKFILVALIALIAINGVPLHAQLQSFANKNGMLLTPIPNNLMGSGTNNATLDAAGESFSCVGYVQLTTGSGTSKTVSAAGGGVIYWTPATIGAFNNGSTNIRIGINDVAATGLEESDTPDVYADLVGGTDTITASVVNTTPMETGTKTIDDGDFIAVTFEMTARGGADSVLVSGTSGTSVAVPYGTADTGSGPTKISGGCPKATIEFDDGTMGWLPLNPAFITDAATGFGTGSTPDEYALVFEVPFTTTVTALFAQVTAVASADDFELILYSDPLGTPVAERTLTVDADLYGVSATHYIRVLSSPYTLSPDTKYAIALRPTTANLIAFNRTNFGTSNGALRAVTSLGTNWSTYTRINQSGAFTNEDTTILPTFGVWLSEFHDGTGSGGNTGRIIGG